MSLSNKLENDPIINIIHKQIKNAIRVNIENKCWGATVILILSGIDTMAYLSMPKNQQDVKKKNFIDWVYVALIN